MGPTYFLLYVRPVGFLIHSLFESIFGQQQHKSSLSLPHPVFSCSEFSDNKLSFYEEKKKNIYCTTTTKVC